MCTFEQRQPLSRLPRAEELCPLFAGISLVISTVKEWRRKHSQARLCHGQR